MNVYPSGIDIIAAPGVVRKIYQCVVYEEDRLEWIEAHPWWFDWINARCPWVRT